MFSSTKNIRLRIFGEYFSRPRPLNALIITLQAANENRETRKYEIILATNCIFKVSVQCKYMPETIEKQAKKAKYIGEIRGRHIASFRNKHSDKLQKDCAELVLRT
jgi:hypothetical protein